MILLYFFTYARKNNHYPAYLDRLQSLVCRRGFTASLRCSLAGLSLVVGKKI